MQYSQQPGWNQQGYPPQNPGFPPGGVSQQGGWGGPGAPQYPAGYGYPGMYHPGQAPGMYPPGMYHPGQPPHGMYPPQAPGAPGMYGGAVQPPKKVEIVKPAANPIEALFGSKADPTATQAAAQQRARRTSNPPPVQPTPQETKPAPKRAPNYNINLSEDLNEGGLGAPGTPSSHATSTSSTPSSSSSSSFPGQPQGGHPGAAPPHHQAGIHSSGGFPPGSHPGAYGGQPGAFPPGAHGQGAHPSGGAQPGSFGQGAHPSSGSQPGAFPSGHPGAHAQGQHPGQHGGFPPGHPGAHGQGPHPSQPGAFPGQGQHHPGAQGGFPPGHPGAQGQGAHGTFPAGAHPPHGAPGFPPGAQHGAFPGQFYSGYPPGAGYGGYGASANSGSFFLPPGGGGATPSGSAPLTPSSSASPHPSPSPVISPTSSQGSFQQGLLAVTGSAQSQLIPSQPSHPPMASTQRPHSPMLTATALQSGQPSLVPSNTLQPSTSSSGIPMQRSASYQQPSAASPSPSLSFPSNTPARPMQQSSSTSNISFGTQFHSAPSNDWAGSDFTASSASAGDDFGGFNAPSANDDFGGFNAPSTNDDFGGFTAASSGDDFGGFNTPSNAPATDDFGFSGFQGASQPAKPQPSPALQQKLQDNLFGFDTPSISAPPAAQSSPAKPPTSLLGDEVELVPAPSPKISRASKHIPPQSNLAEDDFFGTSPKSSPSSAPQEKPPLDLASFDALDSEPAATSAPEAPKKPANALDSMMENSLFKVTHKPPPMAKVAATQPPQQQSQQTQQPQQPAASQNKQSAKKFDWSSQNYRDIFGESEVVPAPNPAIAQEQFEGFVSATAGGASDEFEFGAFEGSTADPFASSSPPSFAPSSFPSDPASAFPSSSSFPSTPFPSDSTFGSAPQSSPFGSDTFVSQSLFPESTPSEPFQPTFASAPSPQVVPSPSVVPSPFASSPFASSPFASSPSVSSPSASSPTLHATSPAHAPSPVVAPPTHAHVPSPSASPFGDSEAFSASFQGSGSEMFSSHHIAAPHDQFGFPSPVSDAPVVSFDSPFAPQTRPATVPAPAPSTSSPSSSSPSVIPVTVSAPPTSAYPNSEPAFGNFFARRASIPGVDDKPLFGDAETAFGDFGKHSNNVPATPANSVVGPPRSPQSEPAFGNFFGNGNTPTAQEEAPAFGDFFGQSKSSAPPTPANTVVRSDNSLLNFAFGDIQQELHPIAPIPKHLRPTRTTSLPAIDFARVIRFPPPPSNPIRRLSTAAPTESFGSFYGDDSARRTGAQADPTFGEFVSKSTSVPPTPANSVDKEGSNGDNFFSDPFGSGASNLKPASDSILAKPLNTFKISPSSTVVSPSSTAKPSGDWGLPSSNANNNNNNNNNTNSNDFFGSPFESATPATTSTASTSSFSSFPTSSSNKNFSLHSDEMFGSSFDTSFGNTPPAFPLEDSFGSPEVAKPNLASEEGIEFGTFSTFSAGDDFGDFSNATSGGDFGDFGPSTPFGEEDITYKPAPAVSLTDLFQSLVKQERLEEANLCQTHTKNGTQPSAQELAAWTSPNASHATIAQLKDRLLTHPNQAKIMRHFAQFEKQPLASVASINLQAAIESQKLAQQFVTAVLEWQTKWERQLAWCATEVAAAQKLTAEICSSSGMQNWDPKKEVFSQEKWATYFKSLIEVYRVATRLNAAAQHFNVPPSPHYATLSASWSVLTAMLKVDEISVDYSEAWDNVEGGGKHEECALCHVPLASSDHTTPWDGASYHLSCANVWANRVSTVPPHVKA